VRLSNAYGHSTLAIGATYVGIRDKGPAVVPGSERQLTFGGSDSTTVAAGALVLSDSVTLDVPPLADLAVTLYLPGEIPPGFQITGRYARQTNYISPPGNFAAAIQMPVGKITDEWFFVSGIDVLASPGVTHAIVMLGTNDLRNRNAKPDEEVTAAQMIAGLHQMALRAQACGIKLLGGTLTPFGNETFLPGAWNPVREGHRVAFN